MAIETQVPPWLSRNWSPRETFDPSPWLQQGYERKIQEQTIPLKIQQMALQNQATQAAIEHQGMVNETAGMQLQQYRNELPRFKALLDETKGDPIALMNRTESFTNPVLQKQFLDAQRAASMTLAGLAATERQKQNWIAYRELITKSPVAPRVGPDGNVDEDSLQESAKAFEAGQEKRYGWHMTYDENGNLIPTALAVANTRAAATEEAARIRAGAKPGMSVEPVVKEIDGEKFLYNPRTGHAERLHKTATRAEFIEKHSLKWAADNFLTPEQAAEKLGQFYDSQVAPAASGETTKASPAQPPAKRLILDPKTGKLIPK